MLSGLRPRPIVGACGVVLAVLVAGSGAARADWLVLVDGTALEIDGPPEVRGRMVVFTLPDGSLSSLQAGDVDLDASEQRTELEARRKDRPRRPPPAAAKPVREAVFVLTDADVGHVSPASQEEAAAKKEDRADDPGDSVTPAQKLVLRQWGQNRSDLGIEVFGVLENRDPNAAAAIRLTVLAVESSGEEVARKSAALDATTLLPGESTRFSAMFDEFPPPVYESIEFDLESIALKAGSGQEPAGSDEESALPRPGDGGS